LKLHTNLPSDRGCSTDSIPKLLSAFEGIYRAAPKQKINRGALERPTHRL
jgi:hypothetical protein